ncbi:MAG: glutamate--tRNA ligase, partial [Actinomycetota bacterium]
EDFKNRLVPYLQKSGLVATPPSPSELEILKKAAPLIQERITVLGEASGMLGFLFTETIEMEEEALKGLPENAKQIVLAAAEVLSGLDEFTTEKIQDLMNKTLVEQMGEKPRNAFGPLRTAISGRRVSPPLFESMEILGKQATLSRLEAFARG